MKGIFCRALAGIAAWMAFAQAAGLPALAQSAATGPGETRQASAQVGRISLDVTGMAEDEREAMDTRLERASAAVQAVDLARSGADDPDAPPVTAQDLFGAARSDYRNLLAALYDEGFYGPEISIRVNGREVAEISPFDLPDRVGSIDIVVVPGPRFTFGQAEVSPRPRAARAPRPIVPGFATGETARASTVGAAANAGLREWRDEGHATAELSEQVAVADHPKSRLDVAIRIAPGPRLRFGELTIANPKNDRGEEISRKRIRQITGFPTGEIYSPEALREAVNRVQRTGVWRTVTVQQAEAPNPDGTLDYSMTLIEELPRRIGFGAEYSTSEGLTVNGFWLHRNIFGGAERLRISGEASNLGGDELGFDDQGGEDFRATVRLTRPGTFGPDNEAFLLGDVESVDDPDFKEFSVLFAAGLRRFFSENLYAQFSAGLRFSDVDDAFGERQFYHVVFPSELEWDRRDDSGDPKSGFYLFWEAEPFVAADADSQTGIFSEIDARSYLSFGARQGTTLAGRVILGNTVGSDLDATPPDYLFFSGGGGTVRGHEFQSLGIEQPGGRDSGGRSFLGLSGEIRQRVNDRIGVVGFVDVGYVDADPTIGDDAKSQTGAGLGIRYATPVGPLRVDLGTPVSDEDDRFRSVEVYIGIGQAF